MKLFAFGDVRHVAGQPPSGGCVLKPLWPLPPVVPLWPAAFGRLCVETVISPDCFVLY